MVGVGREKSDLINIRPRCECCIGVFVSQQEANNRYQVWLGQQTTIVKKSKLNQPSMWGLSMLPTSCSHVLQVTVASVWEQGILSIYYACNSPQLLCVNLIASSKEHLSLRIMHKHTYHPCNICCPEASKEDISPWTSVPVFTSMWSLLLQHLFALVVLVFVCFVNACSVILYLCCRSSDNRFNAAH